MIVKDLKSRFQSLPDGAWSEPPLEAIVLPMARPGQSQLAGFLVAGVNSRRPLDDDYRGFFDLLAGHVASAVANARAYEDERLRAEALAALDRAKTAFFSNVSHEFRTPLTLMLGPVEELLARSHTDLAPAAAGQLEVVKRNGMLLLRLVNTLLDFSRIEAGRVRAIYQPTDLAAFTADLASNFRAACERAGLQLLVDCHTLEEPVFVDREMWEKIVLNLLSNAFKFTFDGEIRVSLDRQGDAVELKVQDSGAGIPAEEMPRLFERFHRIENARSRTHEGSGIGLALVQELVKLHAGSVAAESEVGKGTTFTVSLPLGSEHLPPDQIADRRTAAISGIGATPFIEEALRWLPDEQPSEAPHELPTYHESLPTPHHPSAPEAEDDRPRVIVADDNADMRQYISRLLSEQFKVEAVPDGEAALAAARAQPPDLVLTDVMMPRLNGFGLLKELRADSRTSRLPIIMLSARAGEESRVDGMQAGADDYLVKPFSARELLARVSAHVQMARMRQESERVVRESEQRFRALVNATSDIIYRMGPDWSEMRVLEGRDFIANTDQPTFDWLQKYIPPDDQPHVLGVIHEAIRTQSVFQLEHRVVRPDGKLGWTFSRAIPLLDADGRTVEWFGAASDVTARKEAEERLRESEERLRVTLASIGDAVITTDAECQVLFLNGMAETLTGWKSGDAVGLPLAAIFRIINEQTRQPVENPAVRALRDGAIVGLANHTLLIAKDGTERPVDDSAAPVMDPEGRVLGCVLVFRDVAERRRAEAALRQSEAHFRNMADTAPAMMWVSDPQGDCTFISKQWCEHTATDFRQNLGQGWSECVHPDDRERAKTVFQIANEQRTPFSVDYRLRRRDGEYHWAVDTGLPRFDEHGLFQGFVGTVTDIHDRKQLEEELRQIAAELSAANQKKDEFLATLAHELRNPLAPLGNGLQVMKLARGNPDAVEQSRAMMERQLGQMVRLIDDLLDVSRISRGKITLQKKRVELASILHQAIETSRPLIDACQHQLALMIPPEPVYVDADVTRLSQVFSNLLNNAAKYTEGAGRITLQVERQDTQVVVSVRDTGVGIPRHILPNLFQMFMQVDRSLERSQGGLGIGLSIVKQLTEMHGGSVEAQSEGHRMGSQFIVRLPIAVWQSEDDLVEGQEQDRIPATGRRVLVVDDNHDSARSLALMLRLMGNETQTAHDGLEALDVAEAFRPDLILLDIGMPKLNGYDTARQIRTRPWGKETILIALTGWGQDEDRRRSQEAGFDSHLTKPIDPVALESLLINLQSNRAQ